MIGPKRNGEKRKVFFPKTLSVPRDEANENIELDGKPSQSLSVLLYLPTQKKRKFGKTACLTPDLPRFQAARPDHVGVESSSCCFPWGLVSLVRHREFVSFDQPHVLRSPETYLSWEV